SFTKQLLVERSLLNQLITGTNQANVQAVTAQYAPAQGPITPEFGVEDGFNSINSDFLDPNLGGKANWVAMGRVNALSTGDRKSCEDCTWVGVKNDMLVVGGGGDITQIGDLTNYLHTADIQWKGNNGFSIFVGYDANYIDDGGTDSSTYNWGFITQAGYL